VLEDAAVKILRLVAVGVCLAGCSNLVVLRGSSNDFLKKKAATVTLNSPMAAVQPALDDLFYQRGFRSTSSVTGQGGSQVIIYKGPRPVPPEVGAYGVQLGSWYAARIANGQVPNTTDVTLMGKPMVGIAELCSEHDKLLADIQYVCIDTKMPPDWVGTNYVTGRDETEVVSWVLNGLYERLKR
jgi:hypothetical protein